MKKWKTLNKFQISNFPAKQDLASRDKYQIDKLLEILLDNRGIKAKKDREEFLNPKLEHVTIESVGIDKRHLRKAIGRVYKAIKNKEKIVVFGDYDVDGICGTAILWETLNSLGAEVMPYIPHRVDEGYGLSVKGIQNVISVIPNLFRDLGSSGNKILKRVQDDKDNGIKLIITVDNGIVANKAVEFANKEGIDVIITDHHVASQKLPDASSIVHTTKLCGAGVAYLLSQSLLSVFSFRLSAKGQSVLGQSVPINRQQEDQNLKTENRKPITDTHLELVALATVADLVPLVGANRTFVKFGIEKLRQTKRVGLLELYKEAGLNQMEIGVYEIGHIIAPRLNAMGRLEYAMDSLRLLCTNNRERARKLAQILGNTNRERQTLTIETVEHAKSLVYSSSESRAKSRESREVLSEDSSRPFDPFGPSTSSGLRAGKLRARTIMQKLLFISHESYQQGVIGLVAGKLVEEFYRPAIVVSVGEKYSKASARSISGFNIIEFIRGSSELLIDVGGHPMAAGFTVETSKLSILQKILEEKAEDLLDEERLTRTLKIDCELPLFSVDADLYEEIQGLSPFGMGNPEPTFVSKGVIIEDMRVVGAEKKHIKFRFKIYDLRFMIDAIAFGMGERAGEFHIGNKVDVAYTIDMDTWNGNERLQLKIKDMKNKS